MSLFVGKTKPGATVVIFFFFFFFFFCMLVFQIWVCSDCRAEAIRVFPASTKVAINKATANFTSTSSMKQKKSFKHDLIHKFYFHGRAFYFKTHDRDDEGFQEDKRRIPSCPDPLHN